MPGLPVHTIDTVGSFPAIEKYGPLHVDAFVLLFLNNRCLGIPFGEKCKSLFK